jgi:hypothetical protein
VVLRVLARSAVYEPDSVLLAEKRVEALRPLLEPLPAATPVYTAAQPVLDAIVGFHIHRGVLALGRRGTPPEAEALLAGLGPEALVVALFGIGNHDNMGGLFRNAAAFGADASCWTRPAATRSTARPFAYRWARPSARRSPGCSPARMRSPCWNATLNRRRAEPCGQGAAGRSAAAAPGGAAAGLRRSGPARLRAGARHDRHHSDGRRL